METGRDKREFTRIPIQLEVEVTSSAMPASHKRARIRDVSMKGLYLWCENPFPKGSTCQVTIALGGGEEPVCIQVNGKVARQDPDGMGLEIIEIIGVESFGHLQNLVRYNSPTTEQVERVEQEFNEHLGIKRKHA